MPLNNRPTIIYNNIYSRLTATPQSVVKQVDDLISPKVPGYWFSDKWKQGLWDGRIHFMKSVTNVFPSGFVPVIITFLRNIGLDPQVQNFPMVSPSQIKDFKLDGIELRDYQFDAICACITNVRGVIGAATNSGKTEIAISVAKSLDMKTMFLTHSKYLLHQTAERFSDRLGEEVGKIGDGIWDPRDITIVMVQTLNKHLRTKEVKGFLDSIQILFADECHHLSSNTWYDIVMACNATFRFGLSGTPITGNEVNDARLIGATGPEIFRISNDSLISQGYSAVPKIKMAVCNDARCDEEYAEAYRKCIVESTVRNNMIVKEVEDDDKQTLIIVKMIDHGYIVRDLLRKHKVQCEFLSGQDPSENRIETVEDFKKGRIRALVVSTIFDEGADVPEIEKLIIAAGGKSQIRTLQRIGRGLRKKEGDNVLHVVDFIDSANQYLLDHSNKRYQDYIGEQFEVKIDGEIL